MSDHQETEAGYLFVDGVPGWCDYCLLYSKIAAMLPAGSRFCEIGTWLGSSAIFMAKSLAALGKHDVTITCVDTWSGSCEHQNLVKTIGGTDKVFDAFMANVEKSGYKKVIIPVRMTSTDAAQTFQDGLFAGVFIDADHSEDGVMKDLTYWKPKVCRGGIFAGHDYDFPSVKKSVDAFFSKRGIEIGTDYRSWTCFDMP